MHSPSESPREDALYLIFPPQVNYRRMQQWILVILCALTDILYLFFCSGKQKQGLMQGVNHKH